MSDERTYGEDEVAEIFRRAAASPASARGLTLAELQAIGTEVDLPPERVAEAAASLEVSRGAPRRSALGAPLSVGRTVDLPRAPSDREWEMLVADLRETFAARGRTESLGELREWRNGNLHVSLEPTPAGPRLRMRTRRGDAAGFNLLGGAALLAGLVLLFLALSVGAPPAAGAALMVMGAGLLAANAVRLRAWADERDAQMEAIAARTLALLDSPAS